MIHDNITLTRREIRALTCCIGSNRTASGHKQQTLFCNIRTLSEIEQQLSRTAALWLQRMKSSPYRHVRIDLKNARLMVAPPPSPSANINTISHLTQTFPASCMASCFAMLLNGALKKNSIRDEALIYANIQHSTRPVADLKKGLDYLETLGVSSTVHFDAQKLTALRAFDGSPSFGDVIRFGEQQILSVSDKLSFTEAIASEDDSPVMSIFLLGAPHGDYALHCALHWRADNQHIVADPQQTKRQYTNTLEHLPSTPRGVFSKFTGLSVTFDTSNFNLKDAKKVARASKKFPSSSAGIFFLAKNKRVSSYTEKAHSE